MRDTIKSNEYYEEYLTLNTKRLERFQYQLEALQPDNISGRQGCAAFIANLYWSRMCALYSSGAHVAEVRKIYPQYIKYLVQCVKPQEGYFDVIDAVSLCVLFEAKECLSDLKLVLKQTNMCNKLTDTMLCSLDNTWDVTESDLCCAWFSEFQKCIISDREKFLKTYVSKKWYQAHKDASWHNSHKSTANIYVGYWSFEVAAVAKIYGVPDDKGWLYYPYDLVHADF